MPNEEGASMNRWIKLFFHQLYDHIRYLTPKPCQSCRQTIKLKLIDKAAGWSLPGSFKHKRVLTKSFPDIIKSLLYIIKSFLYIIKSFLYIIKSFLDIIKPLFDHPKPFPNPFYPWKTTFIAPKGVENGGFTWCCRVGYRHLPCPQGVSTVKVPCRRCS